MTFRLFPSFPRPKTSCKSQLNFNGWDWGVGASCLSSARRIFCARQLLCLSNLGVSSSPGHEHVRVSYCVIMRGARRGTDCRGRVGDRKANNCGITLYLCMAIALLALGQRAGFTLPLLLPVYRPHCRLNSELASSFGSSKVC